jgi:xylan 1,4-beta-xylosidase
MDDTHGNVLPAYEQMGSPRYPTQAELASLRKAAALAPAVREPLVAGTVELEIASDGLTVVTVVPGKAAAPHGK